MDRAPKANPVLHRIYLQRGEERNVFAWDSDRVTLEEAAKKIADFCSAGWEIARPERSPFEVIDQWIAAGACRCVVYAGAGQWWPAEETHDGPQQIELGLELNLSDLAKWCEARS